MNHMMRAKAVFGAQATVRVCIHLHAENFIPGGLERVPVNERQ